MVIEELLEKLVKEGGSDLHISSNLPPAIRIDGKLTRVDMEPLSPEDVENLLFPMLSNEQRRTLEQNWELDFSYGIEGLSRFPTGSGKSTTLAAMIDYINENKAEHILTIEDPIEFVHPSKKSIVHQRELGMDTRSFANALKSALREDPDIILVGEMRDHETISLALTAAETGHLVFGTLHTSSASQTIDRIIDVFPEGQQQQLRVQLANSLVAVFAQTLVPKTLPNGQKKGRVMAQEIMLVTPAIANLVRESKAAQIYSTIQMNTGMGMQTLEMALAKHYKAGNITLEDALSKTSRPDEFKRMIDYQSNVSAE